jgi:hypothetical protein
MEAKMDAKGKVRVYKLELYSPEFKAWTPVATFQKREVAEISAKDYRPGTARIKEVMRCPAPNHYLVVADRKAACEAAMERIRAEKARKGL